MASKSGRTTTAAERRMLATISASRKARAIMCKMTDWLTWWEKTTLLGLAPIRSPKLKPARQKRLERAINEFASDMKEARERCLDTYYGYEERRGIRVRQLYSKNMMRR